ncbi:MAG: AAA family ATPase [Rhodobacteraceae bacterium]|nr:AAA family ATPase [Paracoccaceae bacterium]
MAITFITAEERLAQEPKINIAIFGKAGVGKTFQATKLNPETTLFLDGEAGTLTLESWGGTTIDLRKEATKAGVHPWEMAQMIALVLGGPDPAAAADAPYSKEAHAKAVEIVGPYNQFDKFDTIFVDSLTVVSRWSFAFQEQSPDNISAKTGKLDGFAVYGAHGHQMIAWLTHLQHQPKSIIVVGVLDESEDDFGRKTFSPQIIGGMAKNALPGIFDVVMTLANFEGKKEDGSSFSYRAFCVANNNKYGYPAKHRGSAFGNELEQPDLGFIIEKIRAAQAQK